VTSTPGSKTGSALQASLLAAKQELMVTRATDALWHAKILLEVLLWAIASAAGDGTLTSVSLLANMQVATSAEQMRCVSTWYGVSLLKYETDHFFYRTACA
jgi:hypothetical protein